MQEDISDVKERMATKADILALNGTIEPLAKVVDKDAETI
jgi:hypothetical protein